MRADRFKVTRIRNRGRQMAAGRPAGHSQTVLPFITSFLLEHTMPDIDLDAVRAELEKLEAHDKPTGAQAARMGELLTVLRDAGLERLRELAGNGGHIESGDGAARTTARPTRAGVFGDARRSIDAAAEAGLLPDHAAQTATRLVEHGPARDRTIAARWATAAGDPHYLTAFAKLATDPARGHLLWDNREQAAYQATAAVADEMRAMSTGAGSGGEMIPLTLDPSILLTSDGSTDPLRRISRVVQTATNAWQGVTSAGTTAEWLAESAEAADGSPTLDEAPIPVHRGSVFVPYSFEVGMDAVNFVSELQRVLVDAADQLMSEAYMTGSGTGQPTGLVTALPAGSKIASGVADTLTADDAVGVQNALPPRFQARAQWCANLATINGLGSLETTNGSLRFPEISDGRLLRKALNEASHLDAAGDTAAAGNDNVLLYGDFAQFVIVDRIGSTLELIPNLFGANRRPTGERGAFLWFRTGSDVVVDNAFRLLTA